MWLEDNNVFLKEQINGKDKITHSLLNQLSNKTDLTPQNNTSNVRPKTICTAQKMKFFFKGFFSKCDQIRSFTK